MVHLEPAHSGDVFANDIEFNVGAVARAKVLKIGVFPGIGDDGDAKQVVVRLHDGQADTIDAHGSFIHQQVFQAGAIAKRIAPRAVLFFYRQALGHIIHMALHEMPVETPANGQAAFEVDERADLPVADSAAAQRFFNGRDAVAAFSTATTVRQTPS